MSTVARSMAGVLMCVLAARMAVTVAMGEEAALQLAAGIKTDPGAVPPSAMVEPVTPASTEPYRMSQWFERTDIEFLEIQPWWKNRFDIGTRITMYNLTDTSRPYVNGEGFLGSINKLKEDQNYAPVKVFANAWPLKWVGAGISYEKISAKTWTDKPGETGYSDGTFSVNGPILSLLGAWPNHTRFTPFAEIGQMVMSESVDVNPEWANAHGIQGYQDFNITDTKGGTVLGAGCAIQLKKGFEMDILYRQITASVIVDHTHLGVIEQHDREFPLDSNWFGIGLKYRF